MTRIDFYVGAEDPLHYVARLIRKAYALGRKIIILVNDETQQQLLDDMLWCLSDTDFIPHAGLNDTLATQTPVILCQANMVNNDTNFPHYDLCLNLTVHTPCQFAAFVRLCEVVPKAEVNQARERYRAYQKRGYVLTSTKVT